MDLDSIATLAAAPVAIPIGGETFHVHPFTGKDLGRLQAWADAQFPDPFAVAAEQLASGRFSPAQEKHLLAVAAELAGRPRPKLGMPDADRLLVTWDGIVEVLLIAISKGNASFTREQARELVWKMDAATCWRILQITGLALLVNVPKAPASASIGPGPTPQTPSEASPESGEPSSGSAPVN